MLTKQFNKRTLRPLVACLRITVYQGIGKHSSSLSPAMNFDSSTVSLSLNMEKFDKINKMKNLIFSLL